MELCADGQEHDWLLVAEEEDEDIQLEHHWCQKCGCLTQVGFDSEGQELMAVDEDGQPHLDVPSLLMDLAK